MSEGIQASIRRFWLEECTAKMRFQKIRPSIGRLSADSDPVSKGSRGRWILGATHRRVPYPLFSCWIVAWLSTGNPKMIGDIRALRMTLTGVERGDLETFTELGQFYLMPMMHAEDLEVQRPMSLFEAHCGSRVVDCHPPSGYCSALWTVSAPQCHFGACIHLEEREFLQLPGSGSKRICNRRAVFPVCEEPTEPETVSEFYIPLLSGLSLTPRSFVSRLGPRYGASKNSPGENPTSPWPITPRVWRLRRLCFAMLYAGHFKNRVPLAGYAHHVVMKSGRFRGSCRPWEPSRRPMKRRRNPGCRNSYLGVSGGDHESLRPIQVRVDFNGGWATSGLRGNGDSIVPMGITGSHYTAPIFWRSKLWQPCS